MRHASPTFDVCSSVHDPTHVEQIETTLIMPTRLPQRRFLSVNVYLTEFSYLYTLQNFFDAAEGTGTWEFIYDGQIARATS